MKRLHVSISVQDMEKSVNFYSTLFDADPAVLKEDYAKWMLDDPRVNFVVENRGAKPGVDHMGIQAEDQQELSEVYERFLAAEGPVSELSEATCCYAKSDKSWTLDPQGVAWEAFHTFDRAEEYGPDVRIEFDKEGERAPCGPRCC